MRLLFLILLAFICGCAHVKHIAEPAPPYEIFEQHVIGNGWKITQSDNGYDDFETALYTKIFIEMWMKKSTFPQDAFNAISVFNTIEINWQSNVFTYANPADGTRRLVGLTHWGIKPGKTMVFVAMNRGDTYLTIDKSSYGHELIHVALFATTNDSVSNHFSAFGAITWPAEYEEFLASVAQEYNRQLYEN
jgi:hypothetical protein